MSFAITGTLLTVGATAYAANRSSAAARQQGRAADQATGESARQYDQTRTDFEPWRVVGAGALNALASTAGLPTSPVMTDAERRTHDLATAPLLVGDTELPVGTTTTHIKDGWYDVHYGGQRIGTLRPGGANGRFLNDSGVDIPGLFAQQNRSRQEQSAQPTPGATGTPGTPNMSGFFASPDYNFRRTEGTRGIEGGFASRGMGQSGNALRALAEFNSNLAGGEFGNWWNRLAGLAGVGQTATADTASFGARHAENAGRNALIAGDARASGIINQANIIGSGIGQLGSWAGYALGRRDRPTSGGYGGYGGYPWMTPGFGDGVNGPRYG
jgi:hypothetical protein